MSQKMFCFTNCKMPGAISMKKFFEYQRMSLKIGRFIPEIRTIRQGQSTNSVAELQGTLADYNLVIDKIHTGTEMKDIDAEYQALKMENDAEHLKLEQLFKERTQKQQQIHQLEEEIKKVAGQI